MGTERALGSRDPVGAVVFFRLDGMTRRCVVRSSWQEMGRCIGIVHPADEESEKSVRTWPTREQESYLVGRQSMQVDSKGSPECAHMARETVIVAHPVNKGDTHGGYHLDGD